MPPCRRDGRLYLAWLAKQLRAAGAALREQRVAAVGELAEHDVVVNCSGEDSVNDE
jgi:hypothetical protein